MSVKTDSRQPWRNIDLLEASSRCCEDRMPIGSQQSWNIAAVKSAKAFCESRTGPLGKMRLAPVQVLCPKWSLHCQRVRAGLSPGPKSWPRNWAKLSLRRRAMLRSKRPPKNCATKSINCKRHSARRAVSSKPHEKKKKPSTRA